MKRCAVALSLIVVGFTTGCGRSTTAPTSPTVVGAAGQPPVPPTTIAPKSVHAYVSDTAFRVLAGVRLVVVNGPEAGLEMVTDSEGRSSYTGTFPVAVSVRATKDGFVEATAVVNPSTTTNEAWVGFMLAPLTPPTPVAGNYTLTISADPGCTGIPGDVQTRSYQAAVTPTSAASSPPNTFFNGQMTGARFAPYSGYFWIGVAGNYVVVSSEGEGPSIIEDLGHNRYVSYYGQAAASVGASGLETLSAPFVGVIEYCELPDGIGPYYECNPGPGVVREQCQAANSRLTLTRR